MTPPALRVAAFWSGPGGGREVLALAYPLMLSQMSFTLQIFVDRVFLAWHSPEAVAGAVTGLFTVWAVIGLFVGTGEYLTTFVAQYLGAGRPRRIGVTVWQGIYFSLAAGLVCASLAPLAGPVFAAAGHDASVQAHEVEYATTLMRGALPVVLLAALSSFFSGRGQTLVVLLANLLTTVVNGVLDYLWIFGHAGFAAAGVAGAARATVVSHAVGTLLLLGLLLRPAFRGAYGTLAGWRFEPALFGRLLRYGLPAGLQYSLEILAFAVFTMIVGRIGTDALAATGLAFSLNGLVFLPMWGMGIAVSALVGRYLAAGDGATAERVTWSAFGMSLVYIAVWGVAYVCAPRWLLAPYAAGADPATFAPVEALAAILLRFVAVYSIFDAMNVIFSAGLRGAGDTTYPFVLTLLLTWGAMLGPAYIACAVLGAGLYTAWMSASVYVVLVGLTMLRRFRAGHWKSLRMIEPAPPGLAPEAEPAA